MLKDKTFPLITKFKLNVSLRYISVLGNRINVVQLSIFGMISYGDVGVDVADIVNA